MKEENNIGSGFIKFTRFRSFFIWGMIIGFPCLGQQENHINTLGGVEHIASRDAGMSPLMYAGTGFFAGFSWDRKSEKQAFHLAGTFSKGTQRNRYKSPIQYNKGSVQIFSFYHQNRSPTKQLHWGWSVNNLFSHRFNPEFVNFMDHYEYFTNLGPAVKYLYPLQIRDRNLTLEAWAHVQVIGLMIRPSYTSSYPAGFLRRDLSVINRFFYSTRLSHPGNAWNFGFRPRLRYHLNSGNSLSIGYQYEFYQLNTPNSVAQSNGIWMFSLSTKL